MNILEWILTLINALFTMFGWIKSQGTCKCNGVHIAGHNNTVSIRETHNHFYLPDEQSSRITRAKMSLLQHFGKDCETLQGEKFLAAFQNEDVENIAQEAVVGQKIYSILTDRALKTGEHFLCNETGTEFEVVNYAGRDVTRSKLGIGPQTLRLNRYTIVECLTQQ